ncbi:MAG: haloacid dehalogenase-like hydrolase [Alphaproteobacteria bacterium]|nr:haloacid dehalogenase-like hydrolase [Alphaproteobacteria bacterium]
MAKNTTKVALIYDFDETLSSSYMQDFSLIPALGMKPNTFWKRANLWSANNGADQITGSMYYFMKVAKDKKLKLTREALNNFGKDVEYYNGVSDWFERINNFGKALDLEIEHYIISSGYEEIVEGTSIRQYFKDVFACSYAFGEDGTPVWPARIINYSIKTQFLSKINKGLSKNDDIAVNEYTPDDERPIPFNRMIYFGDGMTDIPSMKLTKERGGTAIAVYKPKSHSKKKAMKLLIDNRVNFALPADYSENKEIDLVVKTILDKIATERDLDVLKAKEEKKKQMQKKRLKK